MVRVEAFNVPQCPNCALIERGQNRNIVRSVVWALWSYHGMWSRACICLTAISSIDIRIFVCYLTSEEIHLHRDNTDNELNTVYFLNRFSPIIFLRQLGPHLAYVERSSLLVSLQSIPLARHAVCGERHIVAFLCSLTRAFGRLLLLPPILPYRFVLFGLLWRKKIHCVFVE